jgi:polyisoprenoid-binding protein YceI
MSVTTTTTAVRTLVVDKAHSEALFTVRHLITKVHGRFRDFEGIIHYDEEHPERSSVHVVIQAASIDTNEPDRDKHLRSADFFDVEKNPTMVFQGSRVVKTAKGFDVAGTLTIHGISKAITLPIVFGGFAKDPWGNLRAGFEAEFTVNRKEFGLNWNAALETGGFLVGDEVRITLSIQAIAQN